MLKRYGIDKGKIVEAAEDGQIHLYINPDECEKKHLVENLQIDEHTLISSLDPNELGRIEFDTGHVALIIKRPKRYSAADNFLFKVESVGLFMFKSQLIMVINEEFPVFEGRQVAKVADIKDLVLKIIHRSTFHFEEHLKVISMCSDELETSINKSMGNRELLSMFTLEKSLVFYLNAISSNRRVIEKIKTSAPKMGLSSEQIEYLDDLAIENAQCNEMATIYSQVISGLMDARASVISNNLNVMMKNLNALVIAVAVPSFFAGVGGMSEFSQMIGFDKHWVLGYAVFVLVMILLGMGTFFIIKKVESFWKEY
jgi:magnesium transporter